MQLGRSAYRITIHRSAECFSYYGLFADCTAAAIDAIGTAQPGERICIELIPSKGIA